MGNAREKGNRDRREKKVLGLPFDKSGQFWAGKTSAKKSKKRQERRKKLGKHDARN